MSAAAGTLLPVQRLPPRPAVCILNAIAMTSMGTRGPWSWPMSDRSWCESGGQPWSDITPESLEEQRETAH